MPVRRTLGILLAVVACLSSIVDAVDVNQACIDLLLKELDPPVRYMGVIWSVFGDPEAEMDMSTRVKRHTHFPSARTEQAEVVLRAIEEAAMGLTKPTILYLITQDADTYDFYEREEKPEKRRQLAHVLNECPSIFLLAWNPIIMDPVKGRLGHRTIPIPDFELFLEQDNAQDWRKRLPPLFLRQPSVAWRGSTTGIADYFPYTETDRFRIVETLLDIPGTDVKFSARVQKVTAEIVPDNMMGSSMTKEALAMRRIMLDIDGNCNAWSSMRWKLWSGSAVVKVVPAVRTFTQWYYPLLVDGVHLRTYNLSYRTEKNRSDKYSIAEAIIELDDDYDTISTIAEGGVRFAETYLTKAAAKKYIAELIPNIRHYADIFETMDWRIRTPQSADTTLRSSKLFPPAPALPNNTVHAMSTPPHVIELSAQDDGSWLPWYVWWAIVVVVVLLCVRSRRKVVGRRMPPGRPRSV